MNVLWDFLIDHPFQSLTPTMDGLTKNSKEQKFSKPSIQSNTEA